MPVAPISKTVSGLVFECMTEWVEGDWHGLDNSYGITDNSVMTEIADNKEALTPAVEAFILQWGNLGGQWGVNRSVAQIHALLYVSDRALTAEDIADTLGVARSNVSNSLKELLGWKLIRRVPVFGDRRDHFEAETDLWEMVTCIAAGRKSREIDPAVNALRTCVAQAQDDATINPVSLQRLQAMLDFALRLSRWYDQMIGLPATRVMALINMGARVVKFIGPEKRKTS